MDFTPNPGSGDRRGSGLEGQSFAPTSGRPVAAPHGAPTGPAFAVRKPNRTALIVAVVVAAIVACVALGRTVVEQLEKPDGLIGIVYINGTIGQDGGANTPEGLLSQLNSAENDDEIKAVVLRVDSPGGTAAAGEEMATYVKQFSKPIVVSSASTNASAAYFISSQADCIYANQASSVGSIGTILSLVDYSGLLNTLGIEVTNIASSTSKDAGSGTRPLTPEEIAYYKDLVDQINAVFIEAVAEGRDMPVEDVRRLANGMTMTGEDGVEKGLVDKIGTFEDAIDDAARRAGLSSYSTTSLAPEATWEDLLSLFMASTVGSASLQDPANLTANQGATNAVPSVM